MLSDDVADLLGIWGEPPDGTGPGLFTIMRAAPTFSDSGSTTPNFTQVDAKRGIMQPYRYSGQAETREPGVEAYRDFLIVFPAGTNVLENDRILPPNWVAGQDDYFVEKAPTFLPSHVEVIVLRVTGHAS